MLFFLQNAVSFLADLGGLYCFSIGIFFYLLVQVRFLFSLPFSSALRYATLILIYHVEDKMNAIKYVSEKNGHKRLMFCLTQFYFYLIG